MRGDERIIAQLNLRLAEELTAISQYMVHSEMCESWHYERLHKQIGKRAMQEMGHAEKLIARILYLEGKPVVGNLNKIHVGAQVPKIFNNDHLAEVAAVRGYNESIRIAVELDDNGTRRLLESILKDEEKHVHEIEAQLAEIRQMGCEHYLVEQLGD